MLTIHILDSLNGADGQSSISVIVTSDKGVVFDDTTAITSTKCTCQVYKGITPIEPKSYQWQIINNDSIIRKRIRCLVDIEDTTNG